MIGPFLDSTWLDEAPEGWASALSFLSDQAICFYIPAFLAADLRGELDRVEPMFYMTYGFDDFSRDRHRYCKERWSHLTSEQARAIVHYLEWRIEKEGSDMARAAVEALSAFWYDRAGVGQDGS